MTLFTHCCFLFVVVDCPEVTMCGLQGVTIQLLTDLLLLLLFHLPDGVTIQLQGVTIQLLTDLLLLLFHLPDGASPVQL